MSKSSTQYLHGYHGEESRRLTDQANSLAEILHADIRFPGGERILEVGCGVGAQTVHLLNNNPDCHFVCIDRSRESIQQATQRVAGLANDRVELLRADIFDLPFSQQSFDHLFVCFVLEHLEQPVNALQELRLLLKPGGTLTVIEGDHGSFYCHPDTKKGMLMVQCLIYIQATMGGNGLIGRQLYPLLNESGFRDIAITPEIVWVDDSRPELNQSFSRDTFIAMLNGVKDQAIERGLMSESDWNQGINELNLATQVGGGFSYTFFKARAFR